MTEASMKMAELGVPSSTIKHFLQSTVETLVGTVATEVGSYLLTVAVDLKEGKSEKNPYNCQRQASPRFMDLFTNTPVLISSPSSPYLRFIMDQDISHMAAEFALTDLESEKERVKGGSGSREAQSESWNERPNRNVERTRSFTPLPSHSHPPASHHDPFVTPPPTKRDIPVQSKTRCRLQLMDDPDDELPIMEPVLPNKGPLSYVSPPHNKLVGPTKGQEITVIHHSVSHEPRAFVYGTHGVVELKDTSLQQTLLQASLRRLPFDNNLASVELWIRVLHHSLSMEDFSKALTILWWLWHNRNTKLMENNFLMSDSLVLAAYSFLAAFSAVENRNTVRSVKHKVQLSVIKGISKGKLLADLSTLKKRGKIAGKAAMHNLMFHHHGAAAVKRRSDELQVTYPVPLDEYEFSCSNTPTFHLPFHLNKRKRLHAPPQPNNSDVMAAAVEIVNSVAA
ncbi:hypothetical protein BUALT_Bualt07G0149000 [Buddleja alternifolia]|uniref:Uncharacterized protein n=1 Tax=Buddleja alternifolia TaxID=168488 RepID=A0AAV6XAV1_9LAMI|nr:hypothetical protein BUALT_Bualt07G0149000 [Buddleja alternifolia]